MKNKKIISLKFLVIVLIIFLIINVFFIYSNISTLNKINSLKSPQKEVYEIIKLSKFYNPLSLDGFTKVIPSLNAKNLTISLSSDCYRLDMPTNEYQAYSILTGINNSIDIRPTMHDISKSLFNDLNISILMTEINDKRGDLYLANLFVKQDNKIINIDIKPSDAIAMSVRTNSPVYVKNDLMNKYGIKTC